MATEKKYFLKANVSFKALLLIKVALKKAVLKNLNVFV